MKKKGYNELVVSLKTAGIIDTIDSPQFSGFLAMSNSHFFPKLNYLVFEIKLSNHHITTMWSCITRQ